MRKEPESLLELTRRGLDALERELYATRNMWAAYNAAKREIAYPHPVDDIAYRHLCAVFRDVAELERDRLFPEHDSQLS